MSRSKRTKEKARDRESLVLQGLTYCEVEGDLIEMAKSGEFDVITHGCNCFCIMGAGIAPQMAENFQADQFPWEDKQYRGRVDKLGCIDSQSDRGLVVINSYTQYEPGVNTLRPMEIPLDYEALTLCMRKINYLYKGSKVGLPKIGCGLAGGDWHIVKQIIRNELKDCYVTVVIFNK